MTSLQSPSSHTYMRLDYIDTLIIEGFLQMAARHYPATIAHIRQLDELQGGLLSAKLKSPRSSKFGVDQLAAVSMLLTASQSDAFFECAVQHPLFTAIHNQHITEVVSDNLDEQIKLLSVDLLQLFVATMRGGVSLDTARKAIYQLNLTRKLAHQSSGQGLGSFIELLFPESLIEASEHLPMRYHLVEALVLMNVVASMEAYEGLAAYLQHDSPIIRQLAGGARQALVERYTAQMSIKAEGGLRHVAFEQQKKWRTQDILTNYTYQAAFIALADSNPSFFKLLQGVHYPHLLDMIHQASWYIRLVNDIGSLAIIDVPQLNVVSESIKRAHLETSGGHGITNRQRLARLVNEHENLDLKLYFATILKDIRQNEDNLALDVLDDRAEFISYVDALFQRLTRFNAETHAARNAILKSGLPEPVLMSIVLFMDYCKEMYAQGLDFDDQRLNDSQLEGIRGLRVVSNPMQAFSLAMNGSK